MSKTGASEFLRTVLLSGLAGVVIPALAQAFVGSSVRDPLSVRPRGAEVATALLTEWYDELLERESKDPQKMLNQFRKRVVERYTEGTLQRLADCPNVKARRAAVLALGMMGTMDSNEALAGRLQDDDTQVRQLAADALWSLWFRGDTEANSNELRRLVQLGDSDRVLMGLNALIKKAPRFAEAYNQRAIIYYRKHEYEKSIADCEKVLQANPYHFGALSGMAQCYLNLRKPRAALKAYRNAHRVNPNLEGVQEAIRALEEALGEEGRKDDRK
jgi:tetratricopeptide (TPR) repeat protein